MPRASRSRSRVAASSCAAWASRSSATEPSREMCPIASAASSSSTVPVMVFWSTPPRTNRSQPPMMSAAISADPAAAVDRPGHHRPGDRRCGQRLGAGGERQVADDRDAGERRGAQRQKVSGEQRPAARARAASTRRWCRSTKRRSARRRSTRPPDADTPDGCRSAARRPAPATPSGTPRAHATAALRNSPSHRRRPGGQDAVQHGTGLGERIDRGRGLADHQLRVVGDVALDHGERDHARVRGAGPRCRRSRSPGRPARSPACRTPAAGRR